MRIRSIKPEFWHSDDITDLEPVDRLLFIGLWSYVDDNGVGRDDLALIIGDLFPRDMVRDPQETLARVSGGLSRLHAAGLITRYSATGRGFLHVTTWSEHQRVDKPGKGRYPLPDPQNDADRAPVPDPVAEPSRDPREDLAPGEGEEGRRGGEEQGEKKEPGALKRATRIPDEFVVTRDMRQWAANEVPAVDVNRATRMFVDHFRAASGRTATKRDWVAAWRNWLRRDATPATTPRAAGARESSLDRRDRQVEQMFRELEQLDPIQGAIER